MPIITAPAELPKSETPHRQIIKEGEGSQIPEGIPKEEEMLSPKFADLARKEKAIRSKLKAIEAREQAIAAKEREYETSHIPKTTLQERFKKDPLGVAGEYGVTYDDIAQAALHQPDPVMQKLMAEIESLKATQTQSLTRQDEEAKVAYQNALNQIRLDTKKLVDSDASFETIKETNSVEAVVALIEQTYKETGVLMTNEEAAKEVEDYLLEEAVKMASLKKVKERLLPPTAQPEAQKQIKDEKQTMRTLTNAQASQSKPMTGKDRRERAIAAFRGQLS